MKILQQLLQYIIYTHVYISVTGIFGFISISVAMIPLNYITAPPPFADNSRGTLEATAETFIEIGSSSKLLIAVVGQFYYLCYYFVIFSPRFRLFLLFATQYYFVLLLQVYH